MQADKNTSIFLKRSQTTNLVALGDIVRVIRGESLQSKDFMRGNIPVVAGGTTPAGFHNTSNRPANTITISASGANAGYINFYNKPIFATDCSTISENAVANIHYIYFFLKCNQNKIYKMQTGGAQPHIHPKDISQLQIQLVERKTQDNIADSLLAIEKHISNLEKLISKQESIKKSTINLLLKPKADWIKKTIGDVCSFFTSSSKSAYIDPDGQYFIVDMGAVSDDGTLIAQKRTNYAHDFLHKNDLIMPKDDIGGGNIIGKAVAIQENDKYILSDHVYKLQTELDATFLSYLINSPKINKYMRAMATGSAQLGISKRTVSKCELCFPADLGQQKTIAQKLGAIDEHISNLKLQLKKQQDLKQGLMQYFFGD